MAQISFDFARFALDIKKSLVTPWLYYAEMEKKGGFEEPLIRAILFGVAAGIFNFVWGLFSLNDSAGIFGKAAGTEAGIGLLFWPVPFAVVMLMAGGLLVHLLSRVCGGNLEYEAGVRVALPILALYPVASFLAFAYRLHFYAGLALSLISVFYSIWMLYQGLEKGLSGDRVRARLVCAGLVVLIVLLTTSSVINYRTLAQNRPLPGGEVEEIRELLDRARAESKFAIQ